MSPFFLTCLFLSDPFHNIVNQEYDVLTEVNLEDDFYLFYSTFCDMGSC